MSAQFKLGTPLLSCVFFILSLTTQQSWGGVVAYYSFDNIAVSGSTITDASGNGYNGAFSANVSPGQLGRFGQSFFFNGNSNASEVLIPFATAPQFGSTFAFSLWMNVAAADLDRDTYLLHRGTFFGNQNSIIFGYLNSSFELYAPGRTGDDPRPVSAISSVQPNTWNHLVYTYDGGTFRSYLNGNQTSSAPIAFNLNASDNLFIGSSGDAFGYGDNFRGFIDDVSIWNESLSSAQVTTLYNSPASAVPEPTAIALWTVLFLSSVTIKRRNGGIPRRAI